MKILKVKIKQIGRPTEEVYKNIFNYNSIKKLADESLEDFKIASPTEEIRRNWYNEVKKTNKGYKLFFCNDYVGSNGVNIAILLDVGYVNDYGKWTPGQNYLNEPIRKTYERINKMLQEVK